ncbi:MAG TPA: serine/threonine-protein kinase [Pirellulales bacterium]|nr:serine/threonine-protein kinase [Pirellulales bacterium]
MTGPADDPTIPYQRDVRQTDVFEPGRQIDDFDLLMSLGAGSFANVYLARQRSLSRMVALKVSTLRGSEPQTLAQLDHPHIVRVYDQRTIDPQKLHLMYMEYVPGGTLQDVVTRVRQTPLGKRSGQMLLDSIDENLRRHGQSPPADSRARHMLATLSWPDTLCWIGARLASALEHAHARGVLHRDLKPANVLLTPEGIPKLADFNVSTCSQIVDPAADDLFGGSLGYMSPEQLELCAALGGGDPARLDVRSDLYSLGIVLWELATGERPFRDDGMFASALSTVAARRKQGVPQQAVDRIAADYPAALVEVLLACLHPQPVARIASAGLLRRRLNLCRFPDLQALIQPRPNSRLLTMREHPLPLILVAGLVPNVFASVMNIVYNRIEIIDHLSDERVPKIFERQLITINPIAYALGIAWLLVLAWPVLAAVKRRAFDEPAAANTLERLRVRALKLGDWVALISGIEWLVSGLVFPAWLQIVLGSAEGLSPRQWVHFFASQSMCGLLASTMSFFFVTWYALNVLCPALMAIDRDDPQLYATLDRLARRTPRYTALAAVMVPLAIVVMPLVRTESQMAFLVLGLVGLIASGLAYKVARIIQRSAAALMLATSAEDAETR